MAIPPIVTDWSGPHDFVNTENGFPISVSGMVAATGNEFERGQLWAEPSLAHLRTLMRQAFTDRGLTRAKGVAARKFVVDNLHPDKIAQKMANRWHEIARTLPEASLEPSLEAAWFDKSSQDRREKARGTLPLNDEELEEHDQDLMSSVYEEERQVESTIHPPPPPAPKPKQSIDTAVKSVRIMPPRKGI